MEPLKFIRRNRDVPNQNTLAFLTALALLIIYGLVSGATAKASPQDCPGQWWVTGYASSEWPGHTKDGTPTLGNEGSIVAVDPKVIPLQSTVLIHGLGEFRAADTGAGVKGRSLDVLVRFPQDARNLTGCYSVDFW